MSTTDKTGEKLVDSMRKTKAATASGNSDASQKQGQAPQEKSAPPAKKETAKRPSAGARTQAGDPYQSGRRIWPD